MYFVNFDQMMENELRKKFNLNKKISTNNGWIFSFKDELKIVKVFNLQLFEFNKIKKTFNYLKKINNSSIVNFYEFGFLSEDRNKFVDEYYFYYVMDKLSPITKDQFLEKIIRNYCIDHRRSKLPNYITKELQEFIINIRKIKMNYSDFHDENIMLDKNNNYKLIDLESFAF